MQAKISITQSFERSEILEKRGGPNGPKLDLNRGWLILIWEHVKIIG